MSAIRTITQPCYVDAKPNPDRTPAPVDQVAAFMAANLSYCQALTARITAEQCQKNRRRNLWWCSKCDSPLRSTAPLSQPATAVKAPTAKAKQKMGWKGDCAWCKRVDITLAGKGLCPLCRQEAMALGLWQAKERGAVFTAASAPIYGPPAPPVTPEVFGVDLASDPDMAVIIEVRSGQVRSGQVRSGQVRSGQVRSGQVRSGQVRSGQVIDAGQ